MQEQQPQQGSRISNTEWGLVIGAAVMLDIGEWILDILFLGLVLNPFIDIFVGMALPLYFHLRGVKMNSKKVLTWISSGVLETFLAGAIPLWTFDVVMTMVWDKADKKLTKLHI